MIIDCGTCAHSPDRGDSSDRVDVEADPGFACGDCVVSVLLGLPGTDLGEPQIAVEHEQAIDVLARSGLIPPLRMVPRSQAS
jgi:hypothetical protein